MNSLYKEISPAKLNLFLEVLNRRQDGFHNLESFMTFCQAGDLICVNKSNEFKLTINGQFANFLNNADNIINKAVSSMEHLYKRKFNVNIILEKNLPISSGMGGGSSNAATVIRAIHNIFKLEENENLLSSLLSLGADVPFCYYGKSAVIQGVGERLKFINHELEDHHILLVNPMKEVSTNLIFNKLNFKTKIKDSKKNIYKNINLDYLISRKNTLEMIAIDELQEIRKILQFLKTKTKSQLSRMTGSGATCFAIYETHESLNEAESLIKFKFPSYWICSTQLVNSICDIKLV